ncbi:hypothetical protein [Kordiimonas aquimaris]|uniref:hypothetical protein n=1 Tax=Kordiimonas aquimaris TaxID=707591 RepID=UPI0021D1A599|nr:hypothetical protein [Kordiimonas aquimaris]
MANVLSERFYIFKLENDPMKSPVKFSFEAPGSVVIAIVIALLIVGGYNIEPLLDYVRR